MKSIRIHGAQKIASQACFNINVQTEHFDDPNNSIDQRLTCHFLPHEAHVVRTNSFRTRIQNVSNEHSTNLAPKQDAQLFPQHHDSLRPSQNTHNCHNRAIMNLDSFTRHHSLETQNKHVAALDSPRLQPLPHSFHTSSLAGIQPHTHVPPRIDNFDKLRVP